MESRPVCGFWVSGFPGLMIIGAKWRRRRQRPVMEQLSTLGKWQQR